jgi:hypothetical protein
MTGKLLSEPSTITSLADPEGLVDRGEETVETRTRTRPQRTLRALATEGGPRRAGWFERPPAAGLATHEDSEEGAADLRLSRN